jgi:hypothetical protein
VECECGVVWSECGVSVERDRVLVVKRYPVNIFAGYRDMNGP